MVRSTSLKFALTAAVAGVMVMGHPVEAKAQGKPTAEEKKRLLAVVKGAKAYEEAGDYDKALPMYKDALEIYRSSSILFKVGEMSERTGNLRDAITYYDQLIDEYPDNERAQIARDKLPGIKAQVPPTLKVTSRPTGANVYFGSPTTPPVGSTPYEGELKPGAVTVIISLDGYATQRQEVTLEPADQKSIDVKLEETDGVAPPDDGKKKGTGSPNIAGWATTGTGVVLLVAGGVFSGVQSSRTNAANTFRQDNPTVGREDGQQQIDELKAGANSAYRASLGLYVAGGVVAAAGIGLLVVGGGGSDEGDTSASRTRKPTLRLSVVPGRRSWVGVSGTF